MIKLRHILFCALSFGFALLISGCNMVILNPKGMIAADEKELLITAVLLMLLVVIPVIVLTITFAWKYRASNSTAKYTPDWAHSHILEVVWWGVPCIIIGILAVITWISSHRLDPYRPLVVKGEPLTIQAISLEWKWLFIYPQQGIATINYVEFPAHTPIRFLITSDAPMNSFQIPQLAGQIYAMAGMKTKLNLIANETGNYSGLSTNYSGHGFSDMKFAVKATSPEEFAEWVKTAKHSPQKLTIEEYNKLVQPSYDNSVAYYSSPAKDLFDNVIMKFMMPMPSMTMNNNETVDTSSKRD